MLNAVGTYTFCLSQLRTRNLKTLRKQGDCESRKTTGSREIYCLLVHFKSIITKQYSRNIYTQKHKKAAAEYYALMALTSFLNKTVTVALASVVPCAGGCFRPSLRQQVLLH